MRRHAAMWRQPTTWIVIAAAGRHANGLHRLRRTLRAVDRPRTVPAAEPGPSELSVHIIVPMLREQEHVATALARFSALADRLPFVTVTVVTTGKEETDSAEEARRIGAAGRTPITARRFPALSDRQAEALEQARSSRADGVLPEQLARQVLDGFSTTAKVIAALLSDSGANPRIRHVHYTGEGRKAAQVNHAVEQISKDHDAARSYVAVYDVDSRPDVDLMLRTTSFLTERLHRDGDAPAVLQQSARFTTEGAGRNCVERTVCRGAARLQTLWTLRREIPDFHRYQRATTRPSGRSLADALARGLAQTVGHGLWVRLDVYRRLGGLPTFTLLDDLPFGYRLTIEGIPVHVLPLTATAPAPEDVRELIAQGRRWFHNYLDYPRCAATAADHGHGTAADRRTALAVGAYRGTAWLLRSPAFLLCAATAIRSSTPLPVRAAAGAALWLAVPAPLRALAAAEGRRLTVGQLARESLELASGYLPSSIGPAQAMITAVLPDRGRSAVQATSRRPAIDTTVKREVSG